MKYTYRTGIQKFKTKLINFSTALVVAFTGMTGAAPLFITGTAHAAGTPVVVSPSNMQGWRNDDIRVGGDVSFVSEATSPNHLGALQLSTSNSNDSKASVVVPVTPVPLSNFPEMTYQTRIASSVNPAAYNTTYQVGVDVDGNGTWDGSFVYETYYNGTNTNSWQDWNVASGKFWPSNSKVNNGGALGTTGGGTYASNFTLAEASHAYPNAKILSIGLNLGTYNPSTTAQVSSLSFNGTTYNFVPAPVLAAENFNTTSLATDGYAGISVGFSAKDFTGVSDVTVTMNRAAGGDVVMHGTQDLYNLINQNAAPYQFTAPFVIQAGSYSGDNYWTSAPATWNSTTVPESVTVTVTGVNGTKTVTNGTFSQGAPSWPTYLSTLPNAEVNAENFNTVLDINNPTWGWNGISVGFNYRNFQSVQDVNVKLYSAGKLIAKNTANSTFITNTNSHEAGFYPQATSPFFVQVGSYGTEPYWDLGSFTPKPTEKPDQAVITIVGTDLKGNLVTKTATTTDKLTGPSYASLFDDITPPHTSIVAPTGYVGNAFTISGDATDNFSLNRVYVQLVNRQNNQRYGGTTVNLIGQGKNAHWSVSYDAKALGLPEGTYAANVEAVDMSGNRFNPGWTANFTVDTSKPTATVTYSNNNGNALTKDNVLVTLSANEDIQDINNGWTRVGSSSVFTKTFEHNGKSTVTITDLAGNSSVVNIEVKRIDRQAPIISGVTDGALVQGPVHLSIFDPAYEGAYGFNAATGLTINGVTTKTTETPDHHFLVDVTKDGDYTVVATDKAGNSTTIKFAIDGTAPVVALTNPKGTNAKGSGQYTVSGTVTDDNFGSALFTLLDNKGNVVEQKTATIDSVSGKVTTVSAAFDTTSLKNGRYTVKLTATDAAGNSSNEATNDVTINNDAQGNPFNGGDTAGGRGGDNRNTAPQVQGANTTAALQNTAAPTTDKGSVKGDSTEKKDTIALATETKADDTNKTSAFLGLGWWWLVVVAFVGGLVGFLFRRADTNEVA